MRSSSMEIAVLPERQGFVSRLMNVTEDGLLTVLRKSDNLAYKSNDDHNIDLDEQSPDHLISMTVL